MGFVMGLSWEYVMGYGVIYGICHENTIHRLLVGDFNHLEKYDFVNGVGIIPYMKWKIKVMFEITNQKTRLLGKDME